MSGQLVEGQVYVTDKDFGTDKFFVPAGTRLVYEGADHFILTDEFVHVFRLMEEPDKLLALSKYEISEKLKGMEDFSPETPHWP